MRQDEFKAWFEGYSEGMGDNPPNAKQWDRIKEMVAKIDGTPLTQYVYTNTWRPYWYNYQSPYYGPYYTTSYNPAVDPPPGRTTGGGGGGGAISGGFGYGQSPQVQVYNLLMEQEYAGEHIDTVSATNILRNLGMEDFKHD